MDLLHVIILGAVLGSTSGAGVLPDDPLNAAVGDTVMFTTSLNATQTPFTSILWKFGSEEIITSEDTNTTGPDYEDRITLFISTASLQLSNVTLDDTGEYNVTIVTADGDVMNGLSTLTVWEIISDAVVTSSTQLPDEGQSLNVTCDSSGSVDTREWLKNGSPLNPSENIVFHNQNQVLSFRALSRTDTGRYSCNISNPVSSQEATYTMVVTYGPENIQIFGPNEVEEQRPFILGCYAESLPAASYMWIRNGTTVADTYQFYKNASGFSDGGEYICRATNDITMKTSDASYIVHITEAPKAGLSVGAIAGITVACVVFVVGVAVAGFFIHKKLASRRKNTNRAERRSPPTISRVIDPPNAAKTNDRPMRARVSNHYTDDNVYENPDIYDRNL